MAPQGDAIALGSKAIPPQETVLFIWALVENGAHSLASVIAYPASCALDLDCTYLLWFW